MGGPGHQHEAAVVIEIARWLGLACLIAFSLCVTILPIFAIFRASRGAAGYGYVVASFIFGASLWLVCAGEVYQAWGTVALAIGILIIGVGVLPMAFVALALAGQWWLAAELVAIGALTIGSRMVGMWLVDRSQKIIR